jgi:hypothetical protein
MPPKPHNHVLVSPLPTTFFEIQEGIITSGISFSSQDNNLPEFRISALTIPFQMKRSRFSVVTLRLEISSF